MTDARIRARRDAIRADYATEEAEAAELELLETEQSVLSVRVPTYLAEAVKARAAAEQIPASVLVRRILAQSVTATSAPVFSVAEVEDIARRVHQELIDQPRAA